MSNETFDFSEAVKRMKEGKRIKRKGCIGTYIVSNGKILYGPLGVPLGKLEYRMSPFDADDILAKDWYEVTMKFDDALDMAMNQGKKIRRVGWDENLYVYNKEGRLIYRCIDDFDGSIIEVDFTDFSESRKDMLAENWEEV